MKIYLINPKYPISYWGLEQSHDVSDANYVTPPLALATIAGLTPAEIDVEICDENIEKIDFNHGPAVSGLHQQASARFDVLLKIPFLIDEQPRYFLSVTLIMGVFDGFTANKIIDFTKYQMMSIHAARFD